MPDAGDEALRGEAHCQFLSDHHRAMPSAGAADSDRQITFAFLLIARQQGDDQLHNIFGEFHIIGILADIGGDIFILAGEAAQFRLVMRIGEKARIENQIRLARHAVAIGKRCHENRQAGLRYRCGNARRSGAAIREWI